MPRGPIVREAWPAAGGVAFLAPEELQAPHRHSSKAKDEAAGA